MSNLLQRIITSLILIPTVLFCIFQGSYILIFFTILCLILSLYEWSMMIEKMLLKICGYFFLIISFYFFYKLSSETWKLLFVIVVSVSSDIGGYIFGKIFKGPKLTKISPNKTYAGMLGAYILSIILTFLFNLYVNAIQLSFLQMLSMIILLSTISQVGDITISYFKRRSKLKNTGSILPGHGGLLDRIDGMIFVFPFFYLINLYILLN